MAFVKLTNIQQLDFQINRILTYGEKACNYDEVTRAANGIYDLDTWFRTWYDLGQTAEQDRRFLHAAYYYRLADRDPYKERSYNLSITNFNKGIDADKNVQKVAIPYKNSNMKTFISHMIKTKMVLIDRIYFLV